MSAITVFTYSAVDDSGAGSAVDASAFSTLRLTLRFTANLGTEPQLVAIVEDAPLSTGPWRSIAERQYSAAQGDAPTRWPSTDSIILSGFDKFIRLRWVASARSNFTRVINNRPHDPNLRTAGLSIGLSGDGKPD